jgi:hypothetical protein
MDYHVLIASDVLLLLIRTTWLMCSWCMRASGLALEIRYGPSKAAEGRDINPNPNRHALLLPDWDNLSMPNHLGLRNNWSHATDYL